MEFNQFLYQSQNVGWEHRSCHWLLKRAGPGNDEAAAHQVCPHQSGYYPLDNTQIQFQEGWVRNCTTRVAPRNQKPPFCHFSIARKVGKVVATCRQPQHAEELGQLAEQHPEALYVARLGSNVPYHLPTTPCSWNCWLRSCSTGLT